MVVRFAMLFLAACGQWTTVAPEPDPCAMPQGDFDAQVKNLLLQRSIACSDHRFGRIDDTQYRKRVAVIDAQLAGKRPLARGDKPPGDDAIRLIEWATSVVEFSTQYSENSWSAQQVLGPPDVYPAYGDLNKAWASHGADDREEFIEVAFERKDYVSAVEVYETFNPGAIDKVELITTRGHRIDVPVTDKPQPGAATHRVFETRCTREPIASVRVHLDSMNVAGWNEIDAIGVVPCTR